MAGLGIDAVPVYKRPTAAVISTGDELVEPGGVELAPGGQVYNSNYYTIAYRLRECGVDVAPNMSLGDDHRVIEKTITDMIDEVDFDYYYGGVSVGEKDLMMEIMENLGRK